MKESDLLRFFQLSDAKKYPESIYQVILGQVYTLKTPKTMKKCRFYALTPKD